MIDVIKDCPLLLMYWDFKLNHLDIETTKINRRACAHWICPDCSYSWEAKVYDVYRSSLNSKAFCPCCQLGKLLVKEKNSIPAVFPDFKNYINFHHENKDTILEELWNEKFNSKRVFHLKCPTCQVSWRDTVMNLRLFQSEDKELFHLDCNEWGYHYYYHEAYPNLAKIYSDDSNQISFAQLQLHHNVTLPVQWKCDHCNSQFELSIDQLFNRIKRNGYYCTNCQASFDTPLDGDVDYEPLSFLTPSYLDEWSANNNIAVEQVDNLSNIEVLWTCSVCHGEYACLVREKSQESCPFCSNRQLLSGFNTLDKTHAYLEKFWSSDNDGSLADYWQYSTEPLTWLCPCCQIVFQCSPQEMVLRTNFENQVFQTCPNLCDWNTEVFQNQIFYSEPELVKEWCDKNEVPIYLAQTTIETKKYWWHCSTCQGDYQCSIPIRRASANPCPYCNKETPLKGYNTLLDTYPELVSIWSPKNQEQTDSIVPNEVEKRTFMWHCNSCNLDFKERMNSVLKRYLTSETKSLKDICPYCTHLLPNPKTESLDVVKPLLIEEWQSDIYGSISAIFPSSTAKVNWKCRRCQGEFEARICDREENDNCCPYCAGKKLLSGYNNLEGKYPELIESFSNNNTCEIGEVLYTSKAKWIWECQVCHGEYEDTIANRVSSKFGCPYCFGRKVLPGFNSFDVKQPTLVQEWDHLNNVLLANPSEVSENSRTNVWWICKNNDKHRYKMSLYNRVLFEKRHKEPCLICKGRRRKRKHFVPFKKILGDKVAKM